MRSHLSHEPNCPAKRTGGAGEREGQIGYCCVSLGRYRSRFRTTTLTAVVKKRKEGVKRLREIWRHNLDELGRVLTYNTEANIFLYRISSDLFPLADHPRYKKIWDSFVAGTDLSPWTGQVRQYLEKGGRVTMHPGQFVSLGSPSKRVRKNSIANLELHGEIMDLLGLPATHFAPINIHLSNGRDGEKNLGRFQDSLDRLSDSSRCRLVFENEDKAFWTWQNITRCFPDYPVTLDSHHHRINNLGEDLTEAADGTAGTWGRFLPVRHISEGAGGEYDRSHHDWVGSVPDAFLSDEKPSTDIEVEAKMKDLAALHLKAKHRC